MMVRAPISYIKYTARSILCCGQCWKAGRRSYHQFYLLSSQVECF